MLTLFVERIQEKDYFLQIPCVSLPLFFVVSDVFHQYAGHSSLVRTIYVCEQLVTDDNDPVLVGLKQ